jgi:hypothetical protein
MTRPSDPVLRLLEEGKRRLRMGWCKGTRAKDSAGCGVRPWDPAATSWCVLGSVADGALPSLPTIYLHRAAHTVGFEGASILNDHPRTELRHALGLLDFAGGLRRLDLAKESR